MEDPVGTTRESTRTRELTCSWEIERIPDPQLALEQTQAIREILDWVRQEGAAPTSDQAIGDTSSAAQRNDRLEQFLGPLEAQVLRIIWAARGAVSVRPVLEGINADRSRPLAYTTVQSTMARLARKGVLARTRCGRSHRYQAELPGTAAIAINRLLPILSREALRRALAQIRD